MPANLVAIGGGTGLAVLRRGLKRHVGTELGGLAAVVTWSGDGGSSQRLRRKPGGLPARGVEVRWADLLDEGDLIRHHPGRSSAEPVARFAETEEREDA